MKPPLNSRVSLLKWTKNILYAYGIRPLKKLSQNFVVEPKVITDILNVVGKGNNVIIEIGAGLGTLTYHLAQYNKYVVAVEIDRRLEKILLDVLPWNTDIILGDGLEHIIKLYGGVIVSNLPYHITSPLIIEMLRSRAHKIVLLVQKEVALRLIARPGSKDYGRLTIITQYIVDVELVSVYPPSCFYPKADVASALVVLKRKRVWSREADLIENLTRCLFSEKNKLVLKVLKKCVGHVPRELEKNLKEKRVRDLSLSDIVSLVNYVKNTT